MKCPNCQSSNIQSHIIPEDKRSRNTKILLCVALVLLLICFFISRKNLLVVMMCFVIFCLPICVVLRIILSIIPARNKTVFVCNNCGEEFDKDDIEE